MSGRFTRLIYDEPYYATSLKESVSPMFNRLFVGQKRNCKKCLPVVGSYYFGDRFDSKNPQVDIESTLKGQRKPFGYGRDKMNLIDVKMPNLDAPGFCSKFKDNAPTLLTHPRSHFRELEQFRFYDLQRPASAFIYWGAPQNTQLAAKDAYRTKYPIPLDQMPSLPPRQRVLKNKVVVGPKQTAPRKKK